MPGAAPARVAIDIETTGLQVEMEGITEIGAVKFRGAEQIATFQTLVNPRRPLPYRIQRLTAITPQMIADAPTIDAVAPGLREFIGGWPLVGHNVGFDASFLRRHGIAERNPLIDTFELASMLLPALPSYSLEGVATALGLPPTTHHRALADALLARDVLLALEARIAALPDPLLNALAQLAPSSKVPSIDALRQEQQRRGTSNAAVTGTLGGALTAKLHVNPAVLGTRLATLGAPQPDAIVPAPDAPPRDATLDALVTAALTERQTALAQLAPDPRSRVAALIPALAWAAANGGRLVIAAGSVAGVRETIAELLPGAVAALPPEQARALTATALHGAAEYLCSHRWYGPARAATNLTPDAVRGLAKLTIWLDTTATGARDEVTINPTEQPAWEAVRAGGTFIDLPDCAYRERGWCFARRARDAAGLAHVVVTTHAALLTPPPGKSKGAPAAPYVPPAAGYIILDAQELEEHAIAQATQRLDRVALLAALDGLWRRDGGRHEGLLALAAAVVPGSDLAAWSQLVARARAATLAGFTALAGLLEDAHAANPAGAEGGAGAVRLDVSLHALSAWPAAADAWSQLEQRLTALAEAVAGVGRALASHAGHESLAMELAVQSQELRAVCRLGRECLVAPRDDRVAWATPASRDRRRPGDDAPTLHSAPSQAGAIIGPALARLGAGVVLAGTALAVDGRCDYAGDALGLPSTTRALVLPTDLAGQTLLLVPSDAPEPNMPTYQRALTDAIVQTATALGGRMVVLFASHSALRAAAPAVRTALEAQDIMTLAQGIDGSLRQLWQNFRTQPRVAILGAGGMWDGWESDGAHPAGIFIARLPLQAINEPLIASRAEAYADAMRQLIIPQAALRLRQALNRLAWEHAGRNAVVLFDRRVLTKDYGPIILHTLPHLTQREVTAASLGLAAREWVDGDS